MAKLVALLFSDDNTIDGSDAVGKFDTTKTATIAEVLQLAKIKDWAKANDQDLEATPLCHQVGGVLTSSKAFVLVMRELEILKIDGVVVEDQDRIKEAGWESHFLKELKKQKKALYSVSNGAKPVTKL